MAEDIFNAAWPGYGILGQLEALNRSAEHTRTRPEFWDLAQDLRLERYLDTRDKIEAILDEMWRRFKYVPDPIREHVRVPFIEEGYIDVDDACVFVAAIASRAGVRCRFVFALYKERCWTVRVAYESDGFWTVVDVLRQPWSDQIRFEQMIIGPILELDRKEKK